MDCEVSEEGVAAIRREYEVLVKAGLGNTHEWLDNEDKLLEKMSLLPRSNIKARPTPHPPPRAAPFRTTAFYLDWRGR